MDARDKIDDALAYLKERGVRKDTVAPPLWRLCWRLGWFVPPPHFLGFVSLFLLTGLPFGLVMNLLGGVFLLTIGAPLNWGFGLMGIWAALFFGGAMALYYRWSARRLGVPRWSEFGATSDADDSW